MAPRKKRTKAAPKTAVVKAVAAKAKSVPIKVVKGAALTKPGKSTRSNPSPQVALIIPQQNAEPIKRSRGRPRKPRKAINAIKDNKALLSILDDWGDKEEEIDHIDQDKVVEVKLDLDFQGNSEIAANVVEVEDDVAPIDLTFKDASHSEIVEIENEVENIEDEVVKIEEVEAIEEVEGIEIKKPDHDKIVPIEEFKNEENDSAIEDYVVRIEEDKEIEDYVVTIEEDKQLENKAVKIDKDEEIEDYVVQIEEDKSLEDDLGKIEDAEAEKNIMEVEFKAEKIVEVENVEEEVKRIINELLQVVEDVAKIDQVAKADEELLEVKPELEVEYLIADHEVAVHEQIIGVESEEELMLTLVETEQGNPIEILNDSQETIEEKSAEIPQNEETVELQLENNLADTILEDEKMEEVMETEVEAEINETKVENVIVDERIIEENEKIVEENPTTKEEIDDEIPAKEINPPPIESTSEQIDQVIQEITIDVPSSEVPELEEVENDEDDEITSAGFTTERVQEFKEDSVEAKLHDDSVGSVQDENLQDCEQICVKEIEESTIDEVSDQDEFEFVEAQEIVAKIDEIELKIEEMHLGSKVKAEDIEGKLQAMEDNTQEEIGRKIEQLHLGGQHSSAFIPKPPEKILQRVEREVMLPRLVDLSKIPIPPLVPTSQSKLSTLPSVEYKMPLLPMIDPNIPPLETILTAIKTGQSLPCPPLVRFQQPVITENVPPPPKPVELKKQRAPTKPIKARQPKEKDKAPRKDTQKARKAPSSNYRGKKQPNKPSIVERTASQLAEDEANLVRRSSRIKKIVVQKKSHGLVRSKSELFNLDQENSESSNSGFSDLITPTASPKDGKMAAQKLRNKSNEAILPTIVEASPQVNDRTAGDDRAKHKEVEQRLKQFVHLKDNLYLTDRMACKEAKKMVCDCFLTDEEIRKSEFGCGDDCLNRLLMIECGNLCPVNERCTNKRFQKANFAPVEVFKTEKKGLGLRAAANIPYGEFILEYVGEVLDHDEFDRRAEEYSHDKNIHYYFMSLRADAIIDATMKGNISRFINHSCEPNAETQKWTVNGELRIGFFSTRTILAGEEVTFDYRFQRYGKDAQKCFCDAATCRGWLGEEPNDDSEEEDDEEYDDEETSEEKKDLSVGKKSKAEDKVKAPRAPRKKLPKKPRNEFEVDNLDAEIQMLNTTGLKNQQHTLKLSRLMVRAKEQTQRTKLLRILRHGELPCRRLFLDYHGLRLMHGYMIDVMHLVHVEKKFESTRLEMLQTLAVLPIPNKTMLQDSKVLPTVEIWASNKELQSPLDSDSNSPKIEGDIIPPLPNNTATTETKKEEDLSEENKEMAPAPSEIKKEEPNPINYQEEIVALASKLLDVWSNLKEVFRIPKKERIEQMKEHEREANKKFMASSYANEQNQDSERRSDRYRFGRNKSDRDFNKKSQFNEKLNAPRISKYERRKMFALQVELQEEQRRIKQRELWRQHEQHCMMIGTDPRFTAPFDPNRGFQCIWNPQIGQWQNYPLPPAPSNSQLPPQQVQKPVTYSYSLPPQIMQPVIHQTYPEPIKEEVTQVLFMGPIPPPIKLPPKWKHGKDKYGRPYYYHVKIRISQWEPPLFMEQIVADPDVSSESSSSSDTSSLSSDSSLEDSESEDDDDDEDELDDTRLLLQVRKHMEKTAAAKVKVKEENDMPPSPEAEPFSGEVTVKIDEDKMEDEEGADDGDYQPIVKKRRAGLVEEIIISPRTDEDRLQFREDLKRYKANKEKLKRQKELILQQTRKQLKEEETSSSSITVKKEKKEKKQRSTFRTKIKELPDFNSEGARKIRETFRSNMATVVVSVLNSYRKPDCKEGRITNTEEFKHLARKLTHFVMLKEIKHIAKIEDLTCTDNVKTKAREYIKKYMSKFGDTYQKRHDEPDFKD